MKKIRNFVISMIALVTLVACGGTGNSTPTGTSTPSIGDSSSSSPLENEYKVVLPEVEGFEISVNTLKPTAGETVELYVKNLVPQTRRLEGIRVNGQNLPGACTDQGHTQMYTFTMPANQDAVVTLEAVDVYLVTVDSRLANVLSLVGIGEGLFAEGETVSFTPTTYAGFYYQNVVAVDNDVEFEKENEVYTFVMPAHMVTITATTGENVYLIRYDSTDTNFSLNIENGYPATFGSRVSFKVTLQNPDLQLTQVKVDGEELAPYAAFSYQFVMPAHPVLIEVLYETLYKQITVEDSQHFTATLATTITDGEEPVEVTSTNVVSQQKIWVTPVDKETDTQHGFVVDTIAILGKKAATDDFTTLDVEVQEENGMFTFFTPIEARFLTVKMVEKAAAALFVSGTFVGFRPDSTTGNDQNLSITGDGTIVADAYSGTLTLDDTHCYSLIDEQVMYGMTITTYYKFYVNPNANAILEYSPGSALNGSYRDTYRYSSTKLFVPSDLYSSNYYSILVEDSSTGQTEYKSQFYSVTNEAGVTTTCLFDFTTSTAYWDVTMTVISGTNGITAGDIVEVRAQDGTLLAKVKLTGSSRNVQYSATFVE